MSIISMGTKIVDLRRAVGSGSGGAGGFTNAKSTLFDGVDDYALSSPTYSEMDGLLDFAYSFWFKMDTLVGYQNIFGISLN